MTDSTLNVIERRSKPRSSRPVARFCRDNGGAIALEFALILPVFFYLLIGIIELSLLFFASTVMDGAVVDAARKIRTGQVQSSDDPLAVFQTELCGSIVFLSCNDLTLDVRTFESFSSVNLPTVSLNTDGVLVGGDNEAFGGGFSAGAAREITVVRVIYPWEFFTPMIGILMADVGNTKLLTSGWKIPACLRYHPEGQCDASSAGLNVLADALAKIK